MEEILFSGDRDRDGQLLTGAVEVEVEVTPFPEPEPEPDTAGLLNYHHHHHHHHDHDHHEHQEATALIAPAPPQKLRPIRSNVTPTIDITQGQLGFLPSQSHQQLDLAQIKSQMDANFISTINSQFQTLAYSFSCSSDGSSGDSAGPTVNPKKRKKLESFLEDLLAKVMEKQEQMHKQLMEMIEDKERERIMREEAWRQQEMERAQKEQEMRSQEAARNLALLSFIHTALAQETIQTPKPLPTVLLSGEDDDPNNRRWPTSEVQALITFRTSLDHKFRTVGPKNPLWEQVSAEMASMGYNRNARKCKEKWDNINKYFKKATGNGNKRSENAKSCPYFHELQTLYRNQLINTTKPNSPSDDDMERQNPKE